MFCNRLLPEPPLVHIFLSVIPTSILSIHTTVGISYGGGGGDGGGGGGGVVLETTTTTTTMLMVVVVVVVETVASAPTTMTTTTTTTTTLASTNAYIHRCYIRRYVGSTTYYVRTGPYVYAVLSGGTWGCCGLIYRLSLPWKPQRDRLARHPHIRVDSACLLSSLSLSLSLFLSLSLSLIQSLFLILFLSHASVCARARVCTTISSPVFSSSTIIVSRFLSHSPIHFVFRSYSPTQFSSLSFPPSTPPYSLFISFKQASKQASKQVS
ncbi:hypothetical protein M0802_016722 [Mischocyttarus mexicanus]|nr:hypothetical protein M0802_016785 [Mischocyttarus mexicanus]KAI4472540.1 hypothetical protein M0802_016722 [Mischocyttarus mexicanus]